MRIIYLIHADTSARLQEIASQARTKASIRRLFTYTVPSAIVVRDTTEKLAIASRIIAEQDK